jgi:hypothetical protein
MTINSPAANYRTLAFQAAGVARWNFQTVAGAEGGSNAGGNFQIAACADSTGTALFNVLAFTRATGNIQMPVLQASTTYANDAAAATGGVPVGGLYRNGSVVQIRVA